MVSLLLPNAGIRSPPHLRPFTNLWLDFKLVKELPGKIRLLFMKPGWLPEKYGGYRAPKEVMPESYEKFETKVNHERTGTSLSISYSSLPVLPSFFLVLNNCRKRSRSSILFSFHFSIMSTGFLFEGKKWAELSRFIRLVVAGIILYYFFSDASFHVILSVLLILVTGFSVFWLEQVLPTNAFLHSNHLLSILEAFFIYLLVASVHLASILAGEGFCDGGYDHQTTPAPFTAHHLLVAHEKSSGCFSEFRTAGLFFFMDVAM
jgi:hypothetical protein